ncbi:hypothetical protein XA26_10330 [Mycolicibacterium fortuitum]|uniref:Uncharacterized protein n=1 Tax=Mycolicibacterium fortuitum TaxID=1766 RepID=A0A0N9Y6T3_MYCFO|nr:hypothetical protein G155_05345 [Mycobacterium sp. VKM Ac-1817D]ALI24890.1 hypothetical protein XA26_10330 [Mycolicibacterium fortuitum]
MIARCASIGATRLAERRASQPNTHPAAPVASTVGITGWPAARASAMCDSPNAVACST